MYFVANLEIKMKTLKHNVDYGKTIKLECNLLGSSNPKSVYWQREAHGNKTEIICIDNYKYFGSTISDPSLVISNAILNDSGSYCCSAILDSDSETIQGKKVSVSVRGEL